MARSGVIKKINPSIVGEDGRIKTFKEQLLEYEYGYFDCTQPFVVSSTALCLRSADIDNLPITMRVSTLKKIKDKHDLYFEDLAELHNLIKDDCVLLLDSYARPSEAICAYLDRVDENGKPLFCAFNLDRKAGRADVIELVSVYGRGNVEQTIIKTLEAGLQVYPTPKTRNWLQSIGLQLPKKVASELIITSSRREPQSREKLSSKLAEAISASQSSNVDAASKGIEVR